MIQTLIKDHKYQGKYVALASFDDHKIVGEGTNPSEAYNKAKLNGTSDPVLVFVPLKNVVQIF